MHCLSYKCLPKDPDASIILKNTVFDNLSIINLILI